MNLFSFAIDQNLQLYQGLSQAIQTYKIYKIYKNTIHKAYHISWAHDELAYNIAS